MEEISADMNFHWIEWKRGSWEVWRWKIPILISSSGAQIAFAHKIFWKYIFNIHWICFQNSMFIIQYFQYKFKRSWSWSHCRAQTALSVCTQRRCWQWRCWSWAWWRLWWRQYYEFVDDDPSRERLSDAGDKEEKPESRTEPQVEKALISSNNLLLLSAGC